MKKKTMKAMAGMVALCVCLAGCGKKDIEYVDGNIGTGSVTTEEETGVDTGDKLPTTGNLKETLGVGDDWKWKETIVVNNKQIAIDAVLDVPETEQLFTVQMKKKFYGPEDKKELIETFFDKGTATVNPENIYFPCKENLQERADFYKKNYNGVDYQEEKAEKLEERIAEAPAQKDVELALGDYSSDYYKGNHSGVEYNMDFISDEENNLSGWRITRNEEDVIKSVGIEAGANDEVSYYPSINKGGQSESAEEIQAKAEESADVYLQELGIENMKAKDFYYLTWTTGNETKDVWNGYRLVYTRTIDGVMVDNHTYSNDVKSGGAVRTYDPEKIILDFNEEGIINMEYTGILTQEGDLSPTKLLSYEEMKKIMIKYMEEDNEGVLENKLAVFDNEYNNLSLNYFRMKSDTDSDSYIYIPVWRLYFYYGQSVINSLIPIYYNVWFNAIDGSVIDTIEQGNYQNYNGPQDESFANLWERY